MTRADPSGEPNREVAYRRLYVRIGVQDDCISWLLVELRALQQRVTWLEQHNDDLTAAVLRMAYNNMEEVREGAPP